MDFFASDPFLAALAEDFCQAQDFRIKVYGINGRALRLVEIRGKKPIVSGPFYDYVRPLPAYEGTVETLRFCPKVVTFTFPLKEGTSEKRSWEFDQDPAPLVVWKDFPNWEDYEVFLRTRSKNLLSSVRKRRRRLQNDYGPATFIFANRSEEAFELLCKWKSEQYEGGHETLENPRAIAMLRRLFVEGHLVVSTLQVGGNYVAVKSGFVWNRQYLSLMPAYNPCFSTYGVGKDLLLRSLEESYRQGHQSFDFLQGAEQYKFDFATHVQIIEALGKPPLTYRVRTGVEATAKATISRISPRLFYAVKRTVLTARRFRSQRNLQTPRRHK